jgi:hypothetical protein
MCVHGQPKAVRPVLTLGDIVRTYGDDYRQTHSLCSAQEKALRAIANCRTAILGGHRLRCDHCGAEVIQYNSCRNRHCPTCQTVARLRWVEAREAELLPVPYFHVVFTLPHELNPLAQGNPRVLYNLLFQAASSTLKTFANDPKHLGAELGITMVLHTWGQNLSQHIHVHCIVTGGGLSPDGERWVPCKRNPHAKKVFLFPVQALSRLFRGKYIAGLRKAFENGQLNFARGTEPLATNRGFSSLLDRLHEKPWVVYAKRPFAGPEQVIRYLGRYTHRVAISNHRLLGMDDGKITFLYKDYADHDQQKRLTLNADEFIRRFMLHIVPNGFMRLRHYGLLANRWRKKKLARCRELLHQPEPQAQEKESVPELLMRIAGIDVTLCPTCEHGYLRIIETLAPKSRSPPSTGPPWRSI